MTSDQDHLDRDEIRAVVVEVLTAVAPDVEGATLDPTADLYEDIGLDSMDVLNLAAGLHDRLGVEVAERDYPKLRSVESVVAHVASMPRSVDGELAS